MADLLKKPENSLLRNGKEAPKPKQVFDRQRLFSVDESQENKIAKTVPRKKTTTIRCSQDVADSINALVATMAFDSVDDLLIHLTEEHLLTLTDGARREYETVLKVYKKKTRK